METALSSAPARLAIAIAIFFAFFRAFTSPSGHMWHRSHKEPFWQPCGFQNQAQGTHCPVLCDADPRDGSVGSGPDGSSCSWEPSGSAPALRLPSSQLYLQEACCSSSTS